MTAGSAQKIIRLVAPVASFGVRARASAVAPGAAKSRHVQFYTDRRPSACYLRFETKGQAMTRSSRRDRKAKATANVLAMIADAHPPLAPHQPHAALETDEWLFESATEFCAALDRYAERAQRPSGRRSDR